MILILHRSCAPAIGRRGRYSLPAGCYVYAGSALGSGGLGGRLRRHLRPVQRPHWHIDYLRRVATVQAVWWSAGPRRREHEWAAALQELPTATVVVPGFGASDCACPSHLFYCPEPPSPVQFQRRLGGRPEDAGPLRVWPVCDTIRQRRPPAGGGPDPSHSRR